MANCEQWREAISAYADGQCRWAERRAVEAHLRECADCRRWREDIRADQQLFTEVMTARPADVSDAVMSRVSELSAAKNQPVGEKKALVRWRLAATAVLLMVFGLGLSVGRWAWPREVTSSQIVKVPEVREKIVKVEVPVVKERVVVKRVPVYKTRIVYRERETTPATPVAQPEPMPVKCDEIVIRVASCPIAAAARVTEEVQPAEVRDGGESDETPPPHGHWPPPDSHTTGSAAELVIAQNLSD